MSIKEELAEEAAREGNFGPLFDLEMEQKALDEYLNGKKTEPIVWTPEKIKIAEKIADWAGVHPLFRAWRDEE